MFKNVKTNVKLYREYKKMVAEREAYIRDVSIMNEKDYEIIGLYALDKSCMESMRSKSIVIRFLEAIGRV